MKNSHSPSYVIINILNWNQCAITQECLNSLKEIDYDNFDVVVIDNGSVDNSVQIIKEKYPEVYVIENKMNLGCCEGRNAGIRFSLKRNPDYLFLLDNDTIVDKNILKEFIKVAESDEKIGLIGPLIYYYDDHNRVWRAGGGHIDWFRGTFYDTRIGEIDHGQFTIREIDSLPEGFSFVKRKVLEEIGLFDPDFFFYYEGGEWTTRIKKKGFRIVFAPKAKLWHRISFSHGNESAQFYYYRTRNQLLFMQKSAPKIYLIPFFFYFLYNFFYTTLFTLYLSHKTEQIRACVIGLFDFLRGRFRDRELSKEVLQEPLHRKVLLRLIEKLHQIFVALFREVKFVIKRSFGFKLKILVYLNWNLGDEIIAMPVYKAIKEKYPNSIINVKVKYPELLYNNPYVDKINDRLKGYDRIFNLRGEDKTALRIDYLSKKLKIKIKDRIPKVYLKNNEAEGKFNIVFGNLQNKLAVAISTGTHWNSRQWGLNNFKMITDYIMNKYNVQIIEIGRDCVSIELGINLIGKTTVRQAAIVLSKCNLFIGNDSGLVHLALAVGTPTIALFGTFDPYKLITKQNNFYPVWSRVECRGCWSDSRMIYPDVCPMGKIDCMAEIAADRVVEVAEQIISNKYTRQER